MFVFQKIWRPLLSCYLRFEIHPFALLRTRATLTFNALNMMRALTLGGGIILPLSRLNVKYKTYILLTLFF